MVSAEEVEKVAENSRLNLGEKEVEKFSGEFDEILEMFQKLDEVDTEDVEPAFHPVEVETETRDDEKEECLPLEEVFLNTGNEEDEQFKGPSV